MKKSALLKVRKFWSRWAKDIAPVALGAGLGLVVALVLIGRDDRTPPRVDAAKQPAAQASAPPPGPAPATRMDRRTASAPPPSVLPPPAVAPEAGPSPVTPPPHAVLPAWQRFAVAVAPTGGRPMVAVVIDDMGIDRRRSQIAVNLPGPVTLSYLTYAHDLAHQTAAARAAGHELLVHVPMEPEGEGFDPGPNVLRAGLDRAELDRRIHWALTRFEGFVGINNHMGSRFTADPRGMAEVMSALERRGLIWLDSKTTSKSVGPRMARLRHVPHVERSVFLDNETETGAVRARLAQLERLARRTGDAIAIGHPHDATLEALAGWLPTLQDRGIALVPVSAIVRHRLAAQQKTAGTP